MKNQHDHGGDLSRAIDLFGGRKADWIDLSTGINRSPYPYDPICKESFEVLPELDAHARLLNAAQTAFQTTWPITATPGAQAAIQLLPQVTNLTDVRILSPTYNEFEGIFHHYGATVKRVSNPLELRGAATAVIVNPNNPTGSCLSVEELCEIARRTGTLIVDESFADATPEASLLPLSMPGNVIVLRSFGKFYGLAGLRLGFVLGMREVIAKLANLAGPWAVSGPALEVATSAYSDPVWQSNTRARLALDTARCDSIIKNAKWELIGGTALFRTYQTTDAKGAQHLLAKHHIWSRVFPYSPTWIRLGLPGSESEWERLTHAVNEA
ncbi:MAG: threonine-phosphate decarboxylase [Boseongicola sp.]|nr:threonine-phosphate decarboxylase CobD [Boseongicola sp.]NNL17908.1 threonine-phosphate decarboxylase [Boseongicola sp.]